MSPLLGIYPKELKSDSWINISIPVFIALLFTEFCFLQIQTPHTENKTAERWVYCKAFNMQARKLKATRSNEFWVAHRLRNFYGINMELIWFFQLIGCLVVFLIWIKVAESGGKKSRNSVNRLGIGRLGGVFCWLLRAVNFCKFKFSLCACIDHLHFFPDISDFSLVPQQ